MTFDEGCKNFEINPLKLEEEWVRHPQQVYNAAMRSAVVEMEYEQARSKLKQEAARLSLDIRLRPAYYEVGKVTEDSIQAALVSQPDYQAADAAVIAKQYAMNEVRAAVNALEHKKRALSMLVELWIKEYYSNPQQRSQLGAMSDEEKAAVRNSGRRRVEPPETDRDDD